MFLPVFPSVWSMPSVCHFLGGLAQWKDSASSFGIGLFRRERVGCVPFARGYGSPTMIGSQEVGLPIPQREARASARPCFALRDRRPKTGAIRRRLSPFVQLFFGRKAVTILIGSLVERRSSGANTKAANVDGISPSIPWSSRPSSMALVDRKCQGAVRIWDNRMCAILACLFKGSSWFGLSVDPVCLMGPAVGE
jgi:hypothetical protein